MRDINSWLIGGLLLWLCSVPGCVFRRSAATDPALRRPEPLPAAAWPERWTRELPEYASRRPEVLVIPVDSLRRGEDGMWEEYIERLPYRRVILSEAHKRGIIEEYEKVRPDESEPRKLDVVERNFRFLSWDNEPKREPADDTFDMRGGTGFSLYVPKDRLPRGLVVGNGGGTEWDTELRWSFVCNGWAWLQQWAVQPGENDRPRDFVWKMVESADSAARRLAMRVDQHLADGAFAAEAMLSFLDNNESEWMEDAPIVLIGLSRGALEIPAAAARLRELVDGLVIITGGANLVEIANETALENQAWLTIRREVHESAPRPLTRSEKRSLNEAYLEHTRLDPYAIAPVLRETDVLLLHGMFDRIVPASAGDVLYERLGRPSRWSYSLGHGGVFWMLQFESDNLLEWVNRRSSSRASQTVN